MISLEEARAIALSFAEAEEAPHFDMSSFRIKKKVFATMNAERMHLTIRLSLSDQAMFHAYQAETVYPVPNKWGQQGWTHVNLLRVSEDLLKDLLALSYCSVAPKKLAEQYLPPSENLSS